ncbi:sugar ABC transporter permease [Salinispirillum sp. LH 10-3-1]|uniref:Sugar ABC transporter permease n=1 Tax=Salinispirillum sp. LH 10-3-1 TaxID=2952525 RepID=A0AB38YES9_9GAMM
MNQSMLRQERTAGLMFALPFCVSLFVFFVYALVRTVLFSFQTYDLFSTPEWVGVANYIALLTDPLFALALKHSLAFAVVVTTLQTGLALLLALAANQKIKGRGAFRTIFYFPSILSSAAMTLIFLWLFQRQGLINQGLGWLSAHGGLIVTGGLLFFALQTLQFLWKRRKYTWMRWGDPFNGLVSFAVTVVVMVIMAGYGIGVRALEQPVAITWLNTREVWGPLPRTIWAIVAMNIFTTVPTLMLLYLAGLQSIPESLYEAARIEGASRWQQLRHVTWPRLMPVSFTVVTLGIIGTLQMFDQVALLGDAAPLESKVTLAYFTYHNAFPPGGSPRIGMASAAALVLATLTLILVLIQRAVGVSETTND